MSSEILLSDESNAEVVRLLMTVVGNWPDIRSRNDTSAVGTVKQLIKDHKELKHRRQVVEKLLEAARKSTAQWRMWLATAGTHAHSSGFVDDNGKNWVQREWMECKKIEKFLDEAAVMLCIKPVIIPSIGFIAFIVEKAKDNDPIPALTINGYKYVLENPAYPTRVVNED